MARTACAQLKTGAFASGLSPATLSMPEAAIRFKTSCARQRTWLLSHITASRHRRARVLPMRSSACSKSAAFRKVWSLKSEVWAFYQIPTPPRNRVVCFPLQCAAVPRYARCSVRRAPRCSYEVYRCRCWGRAPRCSYAVCRCRCWGSASALPCCFTYVEPSGSSVRSQSAAYPFPEFFPCVCEHV